MIKDPPQPAPRELTERAMPRAPRRKGAPRPPEMDQRLFRNVILPAFLTVLLGIPLGILIVRQRHVAMDALVAVNGTVIRANDIRHRLDMAEGPTVLDNMVDEELWIQLAASRHVAPTAKQIAAKFAEALKDPTTAKLMAQDRATAQAKRRDIQFELAKDNLVVRGVSVSQSEIKQFYQQNIDPNSTQHLFVIPDEAKIAIIETLSSSEAHRAMRELAAGKSFASVAAARSILQTQRTGGVITIERNGDPNSPTAALEKRVFALSKGQQIGPVPIDQRWIIVRCLLLAKGRAVPFSEVKSACTWDARLFKGLRVNGKRTQSEFIQFKKKAEIDYSDPRYRPAPQVQGA